MKAVFQVRPDLSIEVDGGTQQELFRELAGAAEVFGERTCGLCHGQEIEPVHRTVTKGKRQYEYCEWRCLNPQCGARLNLGVMLEGGRLFPHRKLDAQGKADREHGTAGTHRGWSKYRGQDNHDEPVAASAPASPALITPEQWEQVKAQLVRNGLDVRHVLTEYGVKRPGELPAAKFLDALSKAKAGYAAWKAKPTPQAKRG